MRGTIAHLILLVAGSSVAVLAQVFAPQPMRLNVKAMQSTFPSERGTILDNFSRPECPAHKQDIKRRIDLSWTHPCHQEWSSCRKAWTRFPARIKFLSYSPRKPGRVLIRIDSKVCSPAAYFNGQRGKGQQVPSHWRKIVPSDIFNPTPPVPRMESALPAS